MNLQSQGCDKSFSYFRRKSSALLSGIFFWDDTMIKNEYPSYHPHIVFTYYVFWVFTNRVSEWWQIEDEWFGHFLFVFLNVIAWAFSVRLLFHVHEFLTFMSYLFKVWWHLQLPSNHLLLWRWDLLRLDWLEFMEEFSVYSIRWLKSVTIFSLTFYLIEGLLLKSIPFRLLFRFGLEMNHSDVPFHKRHDGKRIYIFIF